MENLYTVDTYDYTRIQNIPCLHDTRSNRGTKKKKGYPYKTKRITIPSNGSNLLTKGIGLKIL